MCVARTKPLSLIVRRGASGRFEALARKTADLPVVVSWDRRSEDRRASPESIPVERRSSDRRKTPPFTWDAADFVVADAELEPGTLEEREADDKEFGTGIQRGPRPR